MPMIPKKLDKSEKLFTTKEEREGVWAKYQALTYYDLRKIYNFLAKNEFDDMMPYYEYE